MMLNAIDVAYLSRLMEALKSDDDFEITMECPECGKSLERPGEADNDHIILTTWESPEQYKAGLVRTTLAIACEGYHIYQNIG